MDLNREVAVYYETGDYSVSGLSEEIKLKPKQLTARQMEERAKIQAEEKRKKSKEPAFALPGKPAKFPKLKKKKKEGEEQSNGSVDKSDGDVEVKEIITAGTYSNAI